DLTEARAVRNGIASMRPKAIIHCAAATNVDWCEQHEQEAVDMNVGSSASVAEAARECNVQLMYVSTDAVFDGRRGGYDETDAPNPINVYSRTKLDGERQVAASHPSASIVRINTYGWSTQAKPSLAEWMLSQLQQGE